MQPMDRLDNVPDHKIAEMKIPLGTQDQSLGCVHLIQGALNGVDAEAFCLCQGFGYMAMKPMRIATQSNKVSWTVAAAAGLEWAKKSLPKCGER